MFGRSNKAFFFLEVINFYLNFGKKLVGQKLGLILKKHDNKR